MFSLNDALRHERQSVKGRVCRSEVAGGSLRRLAQNTPETLSFHLVFPDLKLVKRWRRLRCLSSKADPSVRRDLEGTKIHGMSGRMNFFR